jgi:hypothetical protein
MSGMPSMTPSFLVKGTLGIKLRIGNMKIYLVATGVV